jgi:DNA/RNA endonuclease G (NUC1)
MSLSRATQDQVLPDRPVLKFLENGLVACKSTYWMRRLAYCGPDLVAIRDTLAGGGKPAFGKGLPEDPHVALVGRAGNEWRAALGVLANDEFSTDCRSDGFEPGAVVVSLATSEAIGELTAPYSYRRVEGAGDDDALEKFAEKPSSNGLNERKGYDPQFLGIPVPLPTVANLADVATYETNGKRLDVLNYTHYSVMMSRSRRLALFTACNIDGKSRVPLTRKEGSGGSDAWYFDPRLDKELQAGPKIYKNSHCDKGHMVRRLDPVWGPDEDARVANDETFFYTNACPQHRDLNRKTWSDLEDYIYDNAGENDLKVSVFTGPIFSKNDVPYRGIQAPVEFWKVVVNVHNGRLSATGYVQSQTDLLNDLEFAFGQFKTYQIPVAEVERRTGLDFGNLRTFDPMRIAAGKRAKALESVRQDIQLNVEEWADLPESFSELNAALKRYDREACVEICRRVIADVHANQTAMPKRTAETMLQNLRANRYFDLVQKLADALINTRQASPRVTRHYAQALIDQGNLSAARFALELIKEPPAEFAEAMGLLGRIDKQLYVNHDNPLGRHAESMKRAYESYATVYATDKNKVWYGINVVAILARAEQDGLQLAKPRAWRETTREVLATLQAREDNSPSGLDVWDTATALEAHVALGNEAEALTRAREYVGMPGASAFELTSTARQLAELWRLEERGSSWGAILTMLRAEILRNQGAVTVSPATLRSDLQKTFGNEGSRSLPWYLSGLERCKAVARIEQAGKGFGTGWLVNASDFVPGKSGLLLITNAHVISPNETGRHRDALLPEQATANFQGLGTPGVALGEVVAWSGVTELDYALLELASIPVGAAPLPLSSAPIHFNENNPPRLYIIGHPQGRDVEFSLQDNYMLGQNERLLHYRTPTEPGSSGSPVFDPDEWKVLGLHHAGQEQLPRLDGRGHYQANEGIAILAIQKHARQLATLPGR